LGFGVMVVPISAIAASFSREYSGTVRART